MPLDTTLQSKKGQRCREATSGKTSHSIALRQLFPSCFCVLQRAHVWLRGGDGVVLVQHGVSHSRGSLELVLIHAVVSRAWFFGRRGVRRAWCDWCSLSAHVVAGRASPGCGSNGRWLRWSPVRDAERPYALRRLAIVQNGLTRLTCADCLSRMCRPLRVSRAICGEVRSTPVPARCARAGEALCRKAAGPTTTPTWAAPRLRRRASAPPFVHARLSSKSGRVCVLWRRKDGGRQQPAFLRAQYFSLFGLHLAVYM